MPQVAIALGSNIGDRLQNLRQAVRHLQDGFGTLVVSSVYETAPMYVEDQDSFLNAVALGFTTLSPREVLFQLKSIENRLGRVRSLRFGPRLIDLDLIVYGSLVYRFTEAGEVQLAVPHSRIGERRFVVEPLAEIAPHWNLPLFGSVTDLLAQTNSQASHVRTLEDALL